MNAIAHNRIEVMHGVNLDQLGRRDPAHYGAEDLPALERRIDAWAQAMGLSVRFFQTNHEGEFVEHLHALPDLADAVVLNPGAWTHYSWAIHDALELVRVPAVEVHLSAVNEREPWRRVSVIGDLCLASISGQGADGYRAALELLARELSE
ncbi:MAG TPA: type II 3-dehydroquinate dehydratase [Solirubrobacteraceae bacterium]|nr:type II 3-dehydroquinate dehydratase [Solirubrobacteraceae bacterium]